MMITTRTLALIPQPTPWKRKTLVFDNTNLKEFVKTNPDFQVLTPTETPRPTPDIEELRQKLYATPTPTPVSGIYNHDLKIKIQGVENRWSKARANAIFQYQLRAFYASLSFEPIEGQGETIRFLKNDLSMERFPLEQGTYRITGEFWLWRRPEERIEVSFGTHSFKDRVTYAISLDRRFEQELLYEMEIRNLEKQKSASRERRGIQR